MLLGVVVVFLVLFVVGGEFIGYFEWLFVSLFNKLMIWEWVGVEMYSGRFGDIRGFIVLMGFMGLVGVVVLWVLDDGFLCYWNDGFLGLSVDDVWE